MDEFDGHECTVYSCWCAGIENKTAWPLLSNLINEDRTRPLYVFVAVCACGVNAQARVLNSTALCVVDIHTLLVEGQRIRMCACC